MIRVCHSYRHRSVICMTEKKFVRPKMSRMCLFFIVLVARCDAAQASPAHPTPSAGLAARNQLPPYYMKKMIPPTDIWGTPVGRLTCGPTKLTHTQGLSS